MSEQTDRVIERLTIAKKERDANPPDDPGRWLSTSILIAVDECIAEAIRNTRSGHGKGLREMGLHAIADELDM